MHDSVALDCFSVDVNRSLHYFIVTLLLSSSSILKGPQRRGLDVRVCEESVLSISVSDSALTESI